jgi:hypothetical protein
LSAALQRGVASVKRSPDPVFGHDERPAGKHRTGKRGQWEGAVLHLRLLRLPRLQRRNWSTGFRRTLGHLATEQTFVTFLRGRANVAPVVPSTSMPNFGEASLPDKKAKDIYAYIRTFKSSAPDLKDIPTLNAIVESAKQDKK